ncbi:MAG: DUF4386 family protein [Propionibacteriales bacterium]|nr:DUF4386 family protein [Propionibacteriales bacterium]
MSDVDVVRRAPLDVVRRAPLERIIGLAGIAGTVLLFTSVITGAPNEPPLGATTAEAADFVKGLDASWVPAVEAVGDIAMMTLLWFMVGLPLLLRRYEGDIPLRSTVATLSAALVAAYVVLDASSEAAVHRIADLDQGQLAYAYDVSTLGFTNVWLPMGSFAFACGWVVVSSGAMPAWLGWWGVVAGIALGLSQFVWTVEAAWLVPYAAFWLWLLTTCAVLVRRAPSAGC